MIPLIRPTRHQQTKTYFQKNVEKELLAVAHFSQTFSLFSLFGPSQYSNWEREDTRVCDVIRSSEFTL